MLLGRLLRLLRDSGEESTTIGDSHTASQWSDKLAAHAPALRSVADLLGADSAGLAEQMKCRRKEVDALKHWAASACLQQRVITANGGHTEPEPGPDSGGCSKRRRRLLSWEDFSSPVPSSTITGTSTRPSLSTTSAAHSLRIPTGFDALDSVLSAGTGAGTDSTASAATAATAAGCAGGGIMPGSVVELLSCSSNAGKTYVCIHMLCAAAITAATRGDDDTGLEERVLFIDTGNTVINGQQILNILSSALGATPGASNNSSQGAATAAAALVQRCLGRIDVQRCFHLPALIDVLQAVRSRGHRQEQKRAQGKAAGTGHYYSLIIIDGLYSLLAPLHSTYSSSGSAGGGSGGGSSTSVIKDAKDVLGQQLAVMTLLIRNIAAATATTVTSSDGTSTHRHEHPPAAFVLTNVTAHDLSGTPLHRAESVGILPARSSLQRIKSTHGGTGTGTDGSGGGGYGHRHGGVGGPGAGAGAGGVKYFKRFCIDQLHTTNNTSTTAATAPSSAAAPAGSAGNAHMRTASSHLFQEAVDVSLLCQWSGEDIVANTLQGQGQGSGGGGGGSGGVIHVEVLHRSAGVNAQRCPNSCNIIV